MIQFQLVSVYSCQILPTLIESISLPAYCLVFNLFASHEMLFLFFFCKRTSIYSLIALNFKNILLALRIGLIGLMCEI